MADETAIPHAVGLGELVDGYRSFMKSYYPVEAERYRSLAEGGQSPRTMVIACSDSRVDPSRIFNAHPGELFIVRNVANLVPPCEEHGDYHGTSAAIEFAVRMLGVKRIVVLGHARCGGIRGFLQRRGQDPDKRTFLDKWISLLEPAHGKLIMRGVPKLEEERERQMEHLSIVHSINNLLTFKFVRQAMERGDLTLHGGMFDIATGQLLILDPRTERFEPVV